MLSGIRDRGRVYVARGHRVEVRGAVTLFAPLQYVEVEVFRRGRRVARDRLLIRRAGRRGAFAFRFSAKRSGRYTIRARHEATPEQRRLSAKPKAAHAVTWQVGAGASGARVRVLQRGLDRLGFVTSRGGGFDAATGRAVLAFRKTNRMARTMFASRPRPAAAVRAARAASG